MNTTPFLFRLVLLSCLLLVQATAWAAQGDNISIGKTSTQSSLYSAGLEADKANNGNLTDTSITGSTPPNAWWQVDLGSVLPVDKVTVYHRTSYVEQGHNIYILASPNPIPAALADALADPNVIQVAHVGAYTTKTSHSMNNAKVRYVKVQHDNNEYLSLAEVEVIEGASPDVIAGAVFRDANGNGSRNVGERGVAGVTVTAYAADGSQAATAVTDANGGYRLTGLVVDANYRVEFDSGTSQGGCNAVNVDDFPTTNAGGHGNSVRFVKSGAVANFGLYSPGNYTAGSANTTVFSAIQYNGDPLAGGDSTAQRWFVGFPYTSSGTAAPPQKLAGDKIGATWGVAYSNRANRLFTTAHVKRHVGLGPMGSGGIYMLEPTTSSFNVTNFFDMDDNSFDTAANPTRTRADSAAPAYGVGKSFTINGNPGTSLTYLGDTDPLTGQPVGLGVVGSNAERGLPASSGTPNYDPAAYSQTGKVGLGDIDISDDGKHLFVTNLYQRKIFRLTLDDAGNPTKVIAVSSYALPDITVTKGVLRPFGLKYHQGKLYVGAVTTGENGGSNTVNGATDLYAHVFTLNEATGNAVFSDTTVLSFPLNYQKGSSGASGGVLRNWVPWSDTATYTTFFSAPSPLLSDLEFTPAGDMVLAFLDRTGNQYGLDNYAYLSSSASFVQYAVGGDVLIAGWDCQNTKFTLENKGTYVSADGKTYNGAANNQGPGGGEFFSGEEFDGFHLETSQGAMALLPGAGELYLNLMDPVTKCAGGTGGLSLSTGISNSRYQLYGNGSCWMTSGLGKANGMGDLELMMPPAPTEIGNRVWLDTDGDGTQGAGEPGIGYVQVKLLAADGTTVLAAATTASDGTYYFSNASGTSTASTIYNITALQPGTAYTVQFPETLRVGEVQYHLTAAVAGGNRLIDSNASSIGYAPITNIDIPVAGANNHSFDVGYTAAVAPKTCSTVSNSVTVSKLTGTTDPTTSNNSATWDVQVNCVAQKIDLKLRKVADKTTVRHGDTLTYTITAENESDVDATGVQVRDDLPMQMTLVKATPSQGTFANGVWEVGNLGARKTATLTLEVKVN